MTVGPVSGPLNLDALADDYHVCITVETHDALVRAVRAAQAVLRQWDDGFDVYGEGDPESEALRDALAPFAPAAAPPEAGE